MSPRPILLTALVCMGFGFTVLFAILAPLGREVGFSEFQISTIIASSSLAVFLASPRWGRLSDRIGRKRVLAIGLAGYVFGTLLFASVFHMTLIGFLLPAIGYVGLIISRVIHASIMAAMMPAASAYMADLTDVTTRTKGMGAVGAAINFGNVIGPAVSGMLATITLLTPLWFAAGLGMFTLLFVLTLLPESPHRVTPHTTSPHLKYTDPRIAPLLIVGITMFSGMAVVQQTLAFRFQDTLQLTAVETAYTFGWAMGLSAAASLASQLFIMQRIELPPIRWLSIVLPLMCVSFVLIALADSRAQLFGAMAVQGAAMGIAGPAFMAGASLAVSADEQGSVAGVAGSCGPLGFTIGPLIGGFCYQIEPTLPYWLSATLFVPLFFIVRHLSRQPMDRAG